MLSNLPATCLDSSPGRCYPIPTNVRSCSYAGEVSLSSPQNENIIDLPKILAVGIASPAATLLTSRFGVAGTLVGLVLSAMFITVAVDVLKVYLARVPGAVTTIPGGLRKKSFFRRSFERMKIPFSKFGSLPRPRRRSILIRSALAAGVSILVGLILITVLELGVGKSLSCWVWEECSTESSAQSSSRTSGEGASTLPSILGGGQSAGSSVPQGGDDPSNPQQQPGVQQQQPDFSPGNPQAPSQEEEEAAPDDPSSIQPGQRQGPAGVPQEEEEEDQQQPSLEKAPEEKQKGSANQQKDSMNNTSEG